MVLPNTLVHSPTLVLPEILISRGRAGTRKLYGSHSSCRGGTLAYFDFLVALGLRGLATGGGVGSSSGSGVTVVTILGGGI